MHLSDLGFHLKDRVISLLNDERGMVKFFSRLGFLALFAGIIFIVAPTSADQTTPEPTPSETPIVETTTAIVDTSTPTPYASPVQVDTSTIAETLTVISVKETTTPLATQPKFTIKIPQLLTVDPRATTKFIPAISISGSEFVLACITGNNINLDVADKKVVSDSVTSGHIIVGDMTSALFISGSIAEVNATLNSVNGLFAYSTSGGISDRSIAIELVAMTHPGVKRSFCDAAKTSATLTFRPMGLGMDTVKSGITLK